MKTVAQSADSADNPTFPGESKAQHRVSSRVSGLENTKAQRPAKKIYKTVRSTLREFFRHLPLQEDPSRGPKSFTTVAVPSHDFKLEAQVLHPAPTASCGQTSDTS